MALFGRGIDLFIPFLALIAVVLLSCIKLKISDSFVLSSFMYYPVGNNLQQIQSQVAVSPFGLWLSLSGHWHVLCNFTELSFLLLISFQVVPQSRSQWPSGLRRGSVSACLLGLWVRIQPGAWMSVYCECCVLSVRQADHSSRGVLPTVVRRCV